MRLSRALSGGQFVRYIVSGLGSTLIDLGLVYALATAGVRANLAVSTGFAAGLLANFLLHKSYTFRHRERVNGRQVFHYGIIVALNYMLTLAIVNLVLYFDASAVVAGKILSIPVVTISAYVLTHKYVFGGRYHAGS